MAFLVACFGVTVARAEPRGLALRDVVTAAARGNPSLGMAVEDFRAATGQLLAGEGLNDPVVDASVNYNRSYEPPTGLQPGSLDAVQATAGVTQPLPTGGKIGLHLSNSFSGSAGGPSPAPTESPAAGMALSGWQPSLTLALTHPLLRGVGVAVARAPLHKARVGVTAAADARGAVAAMLLRDVVSAYWELYFAEHQLEVRRQSAQSARDMLEIVKANISVGKQPPSASAEVEVAIANRESDAIDAEQELLSDAVELERLSGHEPLDPTAPALTDAPPAQADVPSLPSVLALALTGNFDLLAARAGLASADIDAVVARNGKLPELDATIAAGPMGANANAGTAFAQMGRFSAYAVAAGLALTQPTINRAARGLDLAARAARRKADLNEAVVRQQVQASATRAVAAARNAGRRMAVLAPMSDVARLDLEAERARFTAGRSTNFDVLRRQDEVAQVELRRLRANVDYVQALATVEALTGEILPRLGVTLK
jgi:outer membrane protein TolC